MTDTVTGDLRARALADFDYTRLGRTVTPVKGGEAFDVAAHHYPGLFRGGLVEAATPAKHDKHMAAGADALAEPVWDRVRREQAARAAASGKGTAPAAPED